MAVRHALLTGHFDLMAAALHMIVEALFWFHPIVWWLEKRLVALGELSAVLAPLLQRVVVDRTGLVDRFDLDLALTSDQMRRPDAELIGQARGSSCPCQNAVDLN